MTLYDELRQQIADKKVVIVVGAGVAVGATGGVSEASWIGLLQNAVDRCRDLSAIDGEKEVSLRLDVNSGDLDRLLSAAEFVATKLGAPTGGDYAEWLEKSVGALRPTAPNVIEAIRDLGCPIATTNYDNLLEEVTGFPPVTWLDRSPMERVLKREVQGIAHLHGHFFRPESVVLGLRSYDGVLRDEHAQAFLQMLALRERLLFVGFGSGLADPNFGKLLRWMGRVLATSMTRNYRLVLRADEDRIRTEHPPEQRIAVLPFGATHADLEGFLRSLAPARSTVTTPPPASPAPAPAPAPGVVASATPSTSSQPPVSRDHLAPLLATRKRSRRRELAIPGLALLALCGAFVVGLRGLPPVYAILLLLLFARPPLRQVVSLWNKIDELNMILSWLSNLPPHEIHAIPDSPLRQTAFSLIKGSR